MRKRKQDIEDDIEQLNLQNIQEDSTEFQYSDEYQKQLNKFEEQKKKRPRDRQFYVKGADLIQEIRKYQESKKLDAEKRGVPLEEGQGIISEQLRNNDY